MPQDLTGRWFGRWLVLSLRPERAANWQPVWLCRCECGTERAVYGASLRRGMSRSCGCLARELASARRGTGRHRHSRANGGAPSPTYSSWQAMWSRCTHANHPAFGLYGGRGIAVCERWRSFESFLADMGERPAGKTLDRVDNDRGYEPDNCRWATAREQNRNKSNTRRLTVAGESLSLIEWSERTGIHLSTLRERLRRGWSGMRVVGPVLGSRERS